ncbi:hypothetical protein DRF67_17215 [Chryseobacterium pennipullorum]|uniref:Uncharacterized protein n=1 Tax=Chryseobacterium pennipullorum TaxID=2258963 RepID=A0A3D9AUG8_9FLAO|nr:hypothetical protein DRF67_17215 [Chryseobacterium pennipullorum]
MAFAHLYFSYYFSDHSLDFDLKFINLDFGERFKAPGRASCFEAQKTVMRHSKHNLPCSGEHHIYRITKTIVTRDQHLSDVIINTNSS